MQCPICAHIGDNFKEYKTMCTLPKECTGETLVRHQCPKCKVIFGPEDMLTMSWKDLEMMYRRHYDHQREGREKHLARAGLAGINDVVQSGQSCLSWGSGPGSETSRNAEELLGVELWNYEPFDDGGYRIITDEKDLAVYDGIISSDVIEHFQDPVAEFLKMRSHLRPGGKMRHMTSCYKYNVVFTKFHLFFFVGISAQVLAERTGFSLIEGKKDIFEWCDDK